MEAGTGHGLSRFQASAGVFLYALIFYALTAHYNNPYNANEHLILAWNLLHGHPWVDGFGIHEVVHWHGHEYTLHPLLSALVCLPFVTIWPSQVTIEVFVGATSVALVYRLTRSLWLTAFFGLGTVFWDQTTLGAAWGFCLVLSCVPTSLALITLEEGGTWIVGIWAGVAMLARTELAFVIPVYALWRRDWRVLAGALPAIEIYCAFNYWRFGTLYDPSLWLWYQTDQARVPGVGPFSLYFLPYNLYTAIFMAPRFVWHWPWIIPQVSGQSVLTISPAFLLAFAASRWRDETWWLWLCVALSMGPSLLVYSNGVQQFGYRYLIQAYPFLIMLMRRAGMDQLVRALILLSIALTGWGMFALHLT